MDAHEETEKERQTRLYFGVLYHTGEPDFAAVEAGALKFIDGKSIGEEPLFKDGCLYIDKLYSPEVCAYCVAKYSNQMQYIYVDTEKLLPPNEPRNTSAENQLLFYFKKCFSMPTPKATEFNKTRTGISFEKWKNKLVFGNVKNPLFKDKLRNQLIYVTPDGFEDFISNPPAPERIVTKEERDLERAAQKASLRALPLPADFTMPEVVDRMLRVTREMSEAELVRVIDEKDIRTLFIDTSVIPKDKLLDIAIKIKETARTMLGTPGLHEGAIMIGPLDDHEMETEAHYHMFSTTSHSFTWLVGDFRKHRKFVAEVQARYANKKTGGADEIQQR